MNEVACALDGCACLPPPTVASSSLSSVVEVGIVAEQSIHPPGTARTLSDYEARVRDPAGARPLRGGARARAASYPHRGGRAGGGFWCGSVPGPAGACARAPGAIDASQPAAGVEPNRARRQLLLLAVDHRTREIASSGLYSTCCQGRRIMPSGRARRTRTPTPPGQLPHSIARHRAPRAWTASVPVSRRAAAALHHHHLVWPWP